MMDASRDLSISGSSALAPQTRQQCAPQQDDPSIDAVQQFDFYMYGVVIGLLCMFGFSANTLCIMLVKRHRLGLLTCVTLDRMTSYFDQLIQALLVADIFLLWMTFIGDVIPSFGYVTPLLRNRCGKAGVTTMFDTDAAEEDAWNNWMLMSLVRRTLTLLGHVMVVWLTVAVVASGRLTVQSAFGRHQRPGRPGILSNHQSGQSRVKLIISSVFLAAIIYVVPTTFDTVVTVTSTHNDDVGSSNNNNNSRGDMSGPDDVIILANNRWYHLLYINVLSVAVILLPVAAAVCIAVGVARGATCCSGGPRAGSMAAQEATSWKMRRSPMSEAQDVARITLTVVALLVVAYLPQVLLLVYNWLSGTSLHYGATTTQAANGGGRADGSPGGLLSYFRAVTTLLIVANSTAKPVLLCLLGRRYRTCLRHLCAPESLISSSSADDWSRGNVTNVSDDVGCAGGGCKDDAFYDCDPSTKLTLVSSPSGTMNPPGVCQW